MIRRAWIFIFVAASVSPLSMALAGERALEGNLKSFLGAEKVEGQPVFRGGRFPNVVVTLKGTVVVTWGGDGVVAHFREHPIEVAEGVQRLAREPWITLAQGLESVDRVAARSSLLIGASDSARCSFCCFINASTAARCTSTPTRARASTATGTR